MNEFAHFLSNLNAGNVILGLLGMAAIGMFGSTSPADPDDDAWLYSPQNPNSPSYSGD